jgi:hypothetical protein
MKYNCPWCQATLIKNKNNYYNYCGNKECNTIFRILFRNEEIYYFHVVFHIYENKYEIMFDLNLSHPLKIYDIGKLIFQDQSFLINDPFSKDEIINFIQRIVALNQFA